MKSNVMDAMISLELKLDQVCDEIDSITTYGGSYQILRDLRIEADYLNEAIKLLSVTA